MSMLVKLVSLLSAFQLAIAIPGLAPSPSQVSSNPGTQHAQTAGEHWLIIGCFDQFLGAYGYEMDDNLLPPSNSSFLVDVMLDSSNLCNNFQKLNSCLQNRYTALVDFDCLTNLSRSHSDATFYLNQLSMAELFCKESIPFINYSQCSEEIADVSSNDPDGCYQIQWSSCSLVQENLSCLLLESQRLCRTSSSSMALCSYERIRLRMTGWDRCPDNPCSGSVAQYLQILSAIFIVYFISF